MDDFSPPLLIFHADMACLGTPLLRTGEVNSLVRLLERQPEGVVEELVEESPTPIVEASPLLSDLASGPAWEPPLPPPLPDPHIGTLRQYAARIDQLEQVVGQLVEQIQSGSARATVVLVEMETTYETWRKGLAERLTDVESTNLKQADLVHQLNQELEALVVRIVELEKPNWFSRVWASCMAWFRSI